MVYVNVCWILSTNVDSCKYLGVIIDSDLTWKTHIDFVYSKLLKFTSIFYKLRYTVSPTILRTLYFAFVHPHLLYGIELYGNATRSNLNKLIILNNKILRIIQNKPKLYYVPDLCKNYNTIYSWIT